MASEWCSTSPIKKLYRTVSALLLRIYRFARLITVGTILTTVMFFFIRSSIMHRYFGTLSDCCTIQQQAPQQSGIKNEKYATSKVISYTCKNRSAGPKS